MNLSYKNYTLSRLVSPGGSAKQFVVKYPEIHGACDTTEQLIIDLWTKKPTTTQKREASKVKFHERGESEVFDQVEW